MARRIREAVVILMDVGKNTSEKSGDSTFFERAKSCVKKIILRKIISSPQDEIGIVLFGSPDSVNSLNTSQLGFENITEMGAMECPNWDMLRKIEKIQVSETSSSDWIEALLVAVNYANEQTMAKTFNNTRVIMLTNFKTQAEENDIEIIIENVKEQNIELIAVSDTVEYADTEKLSGCHFTQSEEKAESQTASEEIFNRMIENIEGACICHLDHVESQLMYFQRKAKKPFPWNSALTIGSEFRINISAYVHIKEESFFESFKTECADPNTYTKFVKTYTRNNEEIEKPDAEDLITAYMFGGEICPVDEDMKNDGGKKCLSCIAFCKKATIPPKFFCGDGCHLVVPQKTGSTERSSRLFAALIMAMNKLHYVMIARKVYRDNTKPHLVLLSPVIEDEGMFFSMVELPFADDVIYLQFPSLQSDKNKTNDEQAAAMDKLIESMDLMQAIDDDSGVSELQINLNPIQQHMCNVVAYRALHPTDPLPPFDEELKKLFDVPQKIKKQSKEVIDEIEKLFKLEIVHDREKKKPFGQKTRKSNVDEDGDGEIAMASEEKDENYQSITKVGTIRPAEDFIYLVKHSLERFNTLCDQIQGVIFQFMFKVTIDYSDKLKETIAAYREMAKIHGPFQYNKWIEEFKGLMVKRNKFAEWDEIFVKEGLGLISINESPISTLSIEDQLGFYEIKSKNTNTLKTYGEDEDGDDLEALLE